jgi:hypothetical protein
VLLFVREFKQDRVLGSAAAYTFLGTASYVSREDSRPYERHLGVGPPDTGEVPEEDQQAGGWVTQRGRPFVSSFS